MADQARDEAHAQSADRSADTAVEEAKPAITVIGVGGAGGNAIDNMIRAELDGVAFVVANTDAQALGQTLCKRQIQLGTSLTHGLGAGSRPEIGRDAAEETREAINEALEGSHMVFITAGMGGGTGTGAAPVVAQAARELGVLAVGVVTKPFHFEGAHRMRQADEGIAELARHVDTLIVIPNQNLFLIADKSTTFADSFKLADEVLHAGVRSITDLMVLPGLVNLDFADVRSVMAEMGRAVMGTGEAEGDNRAIAAAEAAIANPLLEDVSMAGARNVLINITGGLDLTLMEVDEAANRIRAEVDGDANIIFGSAFSDTMNGKMRVSVIATGADAAQARQSTPGQGRPFIDLPEERQVQRQAVHAQADPEEDADSHERAASSGGTVEAFPARADAGQPEEPAGAPEEASPAAPAEPAPPEDRPAAAADAELAPAEEAEQSAATAPPPDATDAEPSAEPVPADTPDEAAEPDEPHEVAAQTDDTPAPRAAATAFDNGTLTGDTETPDTALDAGSADALGEAPVDAAPEGEADAPIATTVEDDSESPLLLRLVHALPLDREEEEDNDTPAEVAAEPRPQREIPREPPKRQERQEPRLTGAMLKARFQRRRDEAGPTTVPDIPPHPGAGEAAHGGDTPASMRYVVWELDIGARIYKVPEGKVALIRKEPHAERLKLFDSLDKAKVTANGIFTRVANERMAKGLPPSLLERYRSEVMDWDEKKVPDYFV